MIRECLLRQHSRYSRSVSHKQKKMEEVEHRLNKRDIKPTAMRILVLQYLMEQSSSVSLNKIEKHFVNSDKSTLYRTLKTFEKNRLVHTINDGTKQLKYALCLESCNCQADDQHYHFHCTKCQNTFCLTNQNIPKIELPTNFKMSQANLVIKGLCGECNQ